jgi:hypothetical protein
MAQSDCLPGTEGAYLHGNEVRAFLNNSGSLFFNGDEAQFEVPNGDDIHTIFAQGLWLGGIDPGGNLKIAAQTYSFANSLTSSFYPGPLEDGMTSDDETCTNWDRIWCIDRYQLEAHFDDLDDNGVIDNPIDEIIGWPGKGNPNFESIYGFELPDTPQGLAPYFDVNADGIYNAYDGDYPSLEQSNIPTSQLCWNVFNDTGSTGNPDLPIPPGTEVQLTSWAFNCEDNPQLNQSIFLSYKLINRGIEMLDSLYMALWHDFDLGCYTDDYVGHHEATNSVFVYNEDNIDGQTAATCPQGINTFGNNPPAQAVTFLNEELAYGMYYNNGGLPGNPPGTYDPNSPIEYYNYMTGRWRDGSPLEYGGDGYQEGTFPTNLAFPDDPNDPEGWSLLSVNGASGDRRTVSSIRLPSLPPSGVYTVDVAYSFFRMENGDHLSNVTAMYEGLEDLTNWYENSFEGICALPEICQDDCVWPGDLNNDGIANYCDLIALGEAYETTGPTRPAPYNWAPQNGDGWGGQQGNGEDLKHLDADGSGTAVAEDFYGLTIDHYGLTQPGYEQETIVVESAENGLYIEPAQSSSSFEGLEPGDGFLTRVFIEGYEPLRALAFSLEYDPTYFSQITLLSGPSGDLNYLGDHPSLGGMHYAHYAFEPDNFIESGDALFIFDFTVNENLYDIEVPSDTMVLKFANTKGLNANGEEVIIESQNLITTFSGVTISNTASAVLGENTVNLLPNPTTGRLVMNSSIPLDGQAQIFSLAGKRQATIRLNGGQQQMLDVYHWPSGIYFIHITSEQGVLTKKFVKK